MSPSAQLMAVYDMYYVNFISNATDNARFLVVLNLLNDPAIWQSYGTEYADFLNSFASRHEVFLIYAELLSVVVETPKLMTANNHVRLLKMLSSCINPGELLQRCKQTSRLTPVNLDNFVRELNRDLETTSGVPQSQLRHRKPNGDSEAYVTTNVNDLESRPLEKPKLGDIVTPYAEKTVTQNECTSVLGMVTGVIGSLWAGPSCKENKKLERGNVTEHRCEV